MDKNIIKFGYTEIEKHKFQPHKTPNFKSNIDINKIAYLMKFLSVKTVLNTLLDTKMIKKLQPYVSCF